MNGALLKLNVIQNLIKKHGILENTKKSNSKRYLIGVCILVAPLMISSCNHTLNGTAKEVVECVNKLDEDTRPYSRYEVLSDSLKIIYGYLHPDHMKRVYDTSLMIEPSDCEFIIVEYNGCDRYISKVECSHLDYSTISFNKTFFRKGESMNFKLFGCEEHSIFEGCFVQVR